MAKAPTNYAAAKRIVSNIRGLPTSLTRNWKMMPSSYDNIATVIRQDLAKKIDPFEQIIDTKNEYTRLNEEAEKAAKVVMEKHTKDGKYDFPAAVKEACESSLKHIDKDANVLTKPFTPNMYKSVMVVTYVLTLTAEMLKAEKEKANADKKKKAEEEKKSKRIVRTRKRANPE